MAFAVRRDARRESFDCVLASVLMNIGEAGARTERQKHTILLTMTHFHNQPEILNFLRHLGTVKVPAVDEVHFAVTDNSGNWQPEVAVGSNVSIYRPPNNLGYLNGCAFALESWRRGHGLMPDWVGVVNTDLEFRQNFFQLLRAWSIPEDVAIVAPDILLPSGQRQNPHLIDRPDKRRMRWYCQIFRNRFLGRIYLIAHSLRKQSSKWWVPESSHANPVGIYAPHGSAFFVSRTFFEAGGRLEYGSFLYGEELHIAEQARRLDMKVLWAPFLSIRHYEHSTTSTLSIAKRLEWMSQSYTYILGEYFQSD